MKLFSNTERQNILAQKQIEKQQLGVSQSAGYQQSPQSNMPNGNKYSFSQDPIINFIEPVIKSKLFSLPNHISVEEDNAKNENMLISGPQRGSLTPRKKIFNPDNLTIQLKQAMTEAIRPENQQKLFQNNEKSMDQRASTNQHPSKNVEFKPINIPSAIESSPVFGQRSGKQQKQRKGKFMFEHETASKLLSHPILIQETDNFNRQSPKRSSSPTPLSNNYIKMIPSLVDRMDKNERQIAHLKKLLEQLVTEERSRERFARKNLAQRELLLREKEIKLNEKQVHADRKYDRMRQSTAFKSELQREQMRRLEQLIQQNRYLCSKVLEKRVRNSREQSFESTKILEGRITELRDQRQQLQTKTVPYNLHNLDISVIPFQRSEKHLENAFDISRNSSCVPVKDKRSDLTQPTNISKSISSSTIINKKPSGSAVPVRQVRRTKIY